MESEESHDIIIDKVLVAQLLKKLKIHFYDELKIVCESSGFHITDLMSKPKESFVEKNSPSELNNLRYLHHEENRISKIIKIASDIASNPEYHLHKSPSTVLLMKQLNIPVSANKSNSKNSSIILVDAYKTFHTPKDVIQYNYEREREKYEKSLQKIEKLTSIKEQAQKKLQEKLKILAERERKLKADKQKKEEEHEKHTQLQIERRKQILNKKYQIEDNISKEFVDIGNMLELRMKQLSEREKKILRDKIRRKQEKIKIRIQNDFQKIVMDEIKIKAEEQKAEEMIKELHRKIESRVKQYENNVKKKIQTARSHSMKVEQKFTQITREDVIKQEEMLKKIIYKTKKCEEKKDKKSEISRENVEKIKNEISKNFDRHSRGVRDLNEAEIRRLEEIEQRGTEKEKNFHFIQNEIQKMNVEKKSKNTKRERNHSAIYSKTQENYMRYKERIMVRHQKLSQVAEELKIHKDLLSNLKRRRNFEVQDARSYHSSPAKNKQTNFEEVRDLEQLDQ